MGKVNEEKYFWNKTSLFHHFIAVWSIDAQNRLNPNAQSDTMNCVRSVLLFSFPSTNIGSLSQTGCVMEPHLWWKYWRSWMTFLIRLCLESMQKRRSADFREVRAYLLRASYFCLHNKKKKIINKKNKNKNDQIKSKCKRKTFKWG